MPIVSQKPTAAPVAPNQQLPQIQPSTYKGVVYDDKNTPLTSLMAYVNGAPWSVNYYAQVIGEHNDLREVDTSQSGLYQQYTKTIGMEIRVETPLTSSYDTDNGITTVTGTANVYPFLVPNVADYFVANAADNQLAIFRISQVERKTFNRDSVYSIAYDLVGLVLNQGEIFDNLEAKSVRTYHFSKDRLIEGLSPTLRTEEYTKVMNLKALYSDMVQYYFKSFYSQEYGTLIVPGQEFAYYDPFVVNFLSQITASGDTEELRKYKVIATDKEKYIAQPQLFSLMLYKDYAGVKFCNQQMGLVSKNAFVRNSYAKGLAYSNIDYVVYPQIPDLSLDWELHARNRVLSNQQLTTVSAVNGVAFDTTKTYAANNKTYKLIHEVILDNKYVLSSHFYDETSEASVLEILVKDYLKGNTLDLDMLYAVTDTYRQWGRLEQFYYGPLLMAVIKEADRAQYS